MQKTDWKKCKLGDVAEVVGGGTPSTKESLYWNGDVPWLTPKDLSGYNERYISHGERNISEEGLDNSSAILLPASSVLLTSRAPIGYVAIAKNPIATNQGFKSLVLKKGQDPLFYYYLLKANVEYIQNMGSGSTFKEVSGGVVKELTFLIPEYDEQKRIAEILGSLDDKIELLQKQNKTLEDMAKALFKSWFVDFDVVRAKAVLATRRNLSPLRGKCHNVAKGGPNKPNSSCALVSTHQIYAKSVKNLVRAMRQNLTPQEVKLWQYLRKEQLGVKFRRQFPIDSEYIADFACLEKKLIIELDGAQHAENQHDKDRTLYLEDNGFTVLRFWNNEIDKNLIGCLERIRAFLNYPPLPAYGVLSPQGGQKTGEADIMREYHLTEELYDLFPSSFADSPLGPIPSGWEVKIIQDLGEVVCGKTPSTSHKEYYGGSMPFITIPDMHNSIFVNKTERYLTSQGEQAQPTKTLPPFSVCVSCIATPGLVTMTTTNSQTNQQINSVIPHNLEAKFYNYYVLRSVADQIRAQGSGGSVFVNLNKTAFSKIKVLWADQSLQKLFTKESESYFNKILNNLKQIQTLTELRNTLLPRLISGKIRV